MKQIYRLFFFAIVLTASCAPVTVPPPEALLPTITSITQTETFTPIPAATITQTSTSTEAPTITVSIPTLIPPTSAPDTETPSPTTEPTKPPTGEFPGIQVSGYVTLPNGDPIAGIQINYALSAAPYSSLLSVTNAQGYYEGFIAIPHEELVRIWAEPAGYTFKPGSADRSWVNGEFAWHYYGGYENVRLSFIGMQ